MIQYIPHHRIDFSKYDACVWQSVQYRYSATSVFLNATAGKNWGILVKGNYEAVMPVPFIRKWGVKIVVHPKLCQQLGVFSKEDSDEENSAFLREFRRRFAIWYYAFNQDNALPEVEQTRQNFILPKEKYERVYQRYSPKRKRKLRLDDEVAANSECREISFTDAQFFIQKHVLGQQNRKDAENYFSTLSSLNDTGKMKYYAFVYRGEIINLIALYVEQTTVALLGTYNVKEKIKLNGSSKLADFVISQWVETHHFDFEGSDLPAVEEFFRGFRPVLYQYPHLHFSKREVLQQALRKLFI